MVVRVEYDRYNVPGCAYEGQVIRPSHAVARGAIFLIGGRPPVSPAGAGMIKVTRSNRKR